MPEMATENGFVKKSASDSHIGAGSGTGPDFSVLLMRKDY